MTERIRAFVVTAPNEAAVLEVPAPTASPGEAVIAVDRVGVVLYLHARSS